LLRQNRRRECRLDRSADEGRIVASVRLNSPSAWTDIDVTPTFSGSAMHTNVVTRPSSNEAQLPRPDDLGSIALLLDVDGTILDTAITPGSVVVPRSLQASLEELHAKTDGALALVSGRLIRNLDALFAPLRLPAIGGHGAEMRLSGGDATQARHHAVIGDALRNLVAAVAASDPRIIMEDKGSSLALHYRLAPQMEQTLRTEIAAIIARVGIQELEVMDGKAVIEIKPASFSKGGAVREMMENPPFAHRKPVFVGDDTTDESVFRVLPMLGGIGYSVERFIPGANATFDSPNDVRRWLAQLCGSAESDRP
jgi:trehalose 6-phosphate phosphatase